MKNLNIFIIVLFLGLNGFSEAQLTKVTGLAEYPFWLYLPPDSVLSNNPPVLIFLHGRSLSGTDLNRVKRYGVIEAIENGRSLPAIVVAPQVRSGKHWEPQKVLSVLKYVQEKYPTDSNRIYVVGMSLGGSGTFRFAGAYPHLVAGAVAIAGRGNEVDPCRLSQVNLWVIHGKKDYDVPLFNSENIVERIKKCNGHGQLLFTIYPEHNHSTIARVFHKDDLYEWLFKQRKNVSSERK